MDSAFELSSGNRISGAELRRYDPDHVDHNNYRCWVCGVALKPVSYRPHNKKAPHFRLFEGFDHLLGCDGEKGEDSESDQYRRKNPIQEGLPLPYVCYLAAPRKRDVGKIIVIDNPAGDIEEGSTSANADGNTFGPQHKFTVSTILPFARHYIYRHYERHLSIKVFGLPGETFDNVFAELPDRVNIRLPKEHIYFAHFYFSTRPVETRDYVDIKLARGHWEGGQLIKGYTVRLHTAGWSERAKNAVLRVINETRVSYGTIYNNANERSKGWLFCIAEQDLLEPTLLHVKLPQHVCSFVARLYRSGYRHEWHPLHPRSISQHRTYQLSSGAL